MNHGPETLGDNTDGILAFLEASHRSPGKVFDVPERMNDAFVHAVNQEKILMF